MVRNGYLPEREILTPVGAVSVRVPKVRDRAGAGEIQLQAGAALCTPLGAGCGGAAMAGLKGISTGDMREALAILVGESARGLFAQCRQSPQGRMGGRIRRLDEA